MKRFWKFLERLLGLNPCKKCDSYDTHKGHWTSGWNHYCNQASGHNGLLCTNCWHVEYDESLEVRKSKEPKWVETTR